MTSTYDPAFYSEIEAGCIRSAEVVVPLVLRTVSPTSMIDVGCGTAAWAAAFARSGVPLAHGVDGSWVPQGRLRIPVDCFCIGDLEGPDHVWRNRLRQHYDLAVCLEVAEHLPGHRAKTLIGTLTGLAPMVLFSAAVPGQGGVGHVNEQWLDHWQEQFDRCGFRLFDIVRAAVWDDETVEPWYAQNIVLFAGPGVDAAPLAAAEQTHGRLPLRVVHPRVFENSLDAWAGDRRGKNEA